MQWGTDNEDRLRLLQGEVNEEDRYLRLPKLNGCGTTLFAVNADALDPWAQVQTNPTYWPGALSDSEGREIRWHSPSKAQSSQVFCVSAFGTLRQLPDGQEILQTLLTRHFPQSGLTGPWELLLEHTDRRVLDETGRVTPTSLDVFCRSQSGVVCIESKFIVDAREGFGLCSQFPKHCGGFYGPGSDLKTDTTANCRLEVPDGARGARSYWRKGRPFFRESVFTTQGRGDTCPFRGSNFQVMRNVLFAASSGLPAWATLAVVPDRVGHVLREQATTFRDRILRPEYGKCLAVAAYEELIELLAASGSTESRQLGAFLAKRIDTLCGRSQRV